MKLLLGCGNSPRNGFVNLDLVPLKGVDVCADLNAQSYPFKENSFEHIEAQHIIEHLDEPVKVMEELHRIAKSGATVRIQVPYYASPYAWCDPTHKHGFSYDYFSNFTEQGVHKHSTNVRFELLDRRFTILGRGIPVVNEIILAIANSFPRFYERYLNALLKSDDLVFELMVRK